MRGICFIKSFFSGIKTVCSSFVSVFLIGSSEKKHLELKEGEDIPEELVQHVKTVDCLECGCRKCVAYLYLRNRQLEKTNLELRHRWIQVFGRYAEKPPPDPNLPAPIPVSGRHF